MPSLNYIYAAIKCSQDCLYNCRTQAYNDLKVNNIGFIMAYGLNEGYIKPWII